MAINVLIPTPLRKFTENQDTVTVAPGSIGAIVAELAQRYPGIVKPMLDDKGELRKFVNIYLNGEDIRFAEGTETAVKDGDEISIVPAIAGG
jgi:molybdopterin synthase sulfur carrier subunit